MRANIDFQPKSGELALAWLKLRIHLHALRETPRAYIRAAWWRLRGKRVRARSQFAPLLARSPLAYQLWIATEQGTAHFAQPSRDAPRIVALVYDDCDADADALARTQASLAAHDIPAFAASASPGAADIFAGNAECWVMPIFAGDILAPGAGEAYRRAATPDSRLIYSDDDLFDTRGRRHSPHFKPNWNSELFRHLDYLTGACIVRVSASTIAELGDDWPSWIVRAAATSQEGAVTRIAQVLHHRRARPGPQLLPEAPVDARLPRISVIIPTRNGLDLLRTCMEGLARTSYPDMEIIVVDNGSNDPAALAYLDSLSAAGHHVLRHPGPFNFSTLNNRAATQASGDILCLLNNDIEIVDPDWLRVMAIQALRSDVGAVGAQLLYPDGRLQHAGVVLGICGGAAHAHRLLRPDEEGYHRRHALPQFTSAVTAACLVVQRARFEAVGGLDEANFPVAFNDVDFCMRLNRMGWQSLYEPRARLIHHESVSRGFDRDRKGAARLAGELAALKKAWATHEIVDPFHHPQLNRFSEQFVVQL